MELELMLPDEAIAPRTHCIQRQKVQADALKERFEAVKHLLDNPAVEGKHLGCKCGDDV